jgi:uncharacterized protein
VCEQAVIADQPLRRMRGLLGRRSLPAGEGLLLRPAPSIHTAFMRFPIDVIFLDRNLRVVKLVEHLRPWRSAAARGARAALELAAGEAAVRGIEVGDRLGLVTVAGHPRVGKTGAESSSESGHILLLDTHTDDPENREPLKVNGPAADPIHVLLVGKDRRFRSVTAALLTRRGCTVTLAERIDWASELASLENPDVVVIDVGPSPTAGTREAAKIQTLEPPVGVVLVGEESEDRPPLMPILAKWESFDELFAAVESARPNPTRRSSDG